ncbi:MAG: hypothetical protein AB7O21_03305 [Gammaproteobacteria bacterium]
MFGRILKWLVIVIAVAVGGVEIYGRHMLKLKPGLAENHLAEALVKFAEYDQRTGMAYRINVDQLIDSPYGDFQILYKTNEIGLRDRPMGTHLRQELKFLVFGDEFAEGWGADIDQTFVVQAQLQVNEKTALKPPVRLVIAGKSGYGAAQNYLAAEPLIDALKPRAIVFVYSSLMPHADALFLRDAELVDGLATGLKAATGEVRLPHLADYPATPPAWLAALARGSVAGRLAAEWYGVQAAGAALTPGDPRTDRVAGIRAGADLDAVHAESLRHVRALATLAERRGIPFLLVHVPLPPQVAADAWAEGRRIFRVSAGLHDPVDVPVVAGFCSEANLRCLHLHEEMRETAARLQSTRLYQPGELALTIDGAGVIGRWLADEIYRWLGELGERR